MSDRHRKCISLLRLVDEDLLVSQDVNRFFVSHRTLASEASDWQLIRFYKGYICSMVTKVSADIDWNLRHRKSL